MREKFKKFIKAVNEKLFFNLLKGIYILFLNFKINFYYFFIRKKQEFLNISFNNYNNNSLTKLCEFYKSDKGSINHNKKGIWGLEGAYL